MADIKINQSDVHESDSVEGLADGTPVLEIAGATYDLMGLTLKMAEADDTRGFPRSVVLEGLKALAGYEVKSVKKTETDQKLREAEESRIKAQETVIKPLFVELADILAGFESVPDTILAEAHCRISFRTGVVSLDIPSGIGADQLKGFADSLEGQSIGFRYDPKADAEASRWIPALKSAGTRSNGSYALLDGSYRMNPDKGKGDGAVEDFRFLVKSGKVYVDGKVISGLDFLSSLTVETGNADNPTRPFSQPSKRIQAVTAWERDLTEAEIAPVETPTETESPEPPTEADGPDQ